MIPDDFIQQLLSRVDIVEVIDRSVPLKKAGANYLACCPFHKEKSPSFTVSPSKQFYHCFGCGAHGSAIKFLMEYAGKTFPDAVEELAQSVGLQVPRDDTKKADPSAGPLFDAMIVAANYYKSNLRHSELAIDYFKRRGVSGEIAKRYHLGWAKPEWQGLEEVFEDYSDNELLLTGGLVKLGDGDRRYDTFRERVMFPILNQQGAVIGFGGRILGSKDDGHGPKYLNSPETPIFSKGRELYGLFQAQAAIRKTNRVLVVEGYMDVIALAQYGVEYAVATLGTATTEAHTQRLLRLADEVVFSFDGDAAGQRAAWRALENALPALRDGKRVRFLFLPTEHDPDSYVREHGREAFEAFIDSALPLSQYWLRELNARHAGDSAEAKAARAAAGRAHLELVSAPMMRESLAKALEADVNIAAHSLLPPVKMRPTEPTSTENGFEPRTKYVGKRPPIPRNDPAAQRVNAAARRILARPKLAMHLIDIVLPADLQDFAQRPRPLRLLQVVVDVAIHLPDEPNHGAVLERFRDTEFANDVAQLLTHRDHELDSAMTDEDIEQELRSLKTQIESGALFSVTRAIEIPRHLANAGILALQSRRNGIPLPPGSVPPSSSPSSSNPARSMSPPSAPDTDDQSNDVPFDSSRPSAPPPADDAAPF